jgi:hypothetical protein
MFEGLAIGKNELDRCECERFFGVIWIFCDKTCEFAAFNELFDERAAKLIDLNNQMFAQ